MGYTATENQGVDKKDVTMKHTTLNRAQLIDLLTATVPARARFTPGAIQEIVPGRPERMFYAVWDRRLKGKRISCAAHLVIATTEGKKLGE